MKVDSKTKTDYLPGFSDGVTKLTAFVKRLLILPTIMLPPLQRALHVGQITKSAIGLRGFIGALKEWSSLHNDSKSAIICEACALKNGQSTMAALMR